MAQPPTRYVLTTNSFPHGSPNPGTVTSPGLYRRGGLQSEAPAEASRALVIFVNAKGKQHLKHVDSWERNYGFSLFFETSNKKSHGVVFFNFISFKSVYNHQTYGVGWDINPISCTMLGVKWQQDLGKQSLGRLFFSWGIIACKPAIIRYRLRCFVCTCAWDEICKTWAIRTTKTGIVINPLIEMFTDYGGWIPMVNDGRHKNPM